MYIQRILPTEDIHVRMPKDRRSMVPKHNLQKIFIVTFIICSAAVEANPDKSSKHPVTSPVPGSLMYASPTSHDLIDEDFLHRSSINVPQPRKILISHAKRKFTGIGRPRALLPPGQKRRRRIFNMMKNKLSKHKASATHVLARKMIQKLKKVKAPEPSLITDVSRSLLLNTSLPEADKVKTTSTTSIKPITKTPPVYKPGPAIIKFAPDKDDFIKAGLLQNITQNIEKKSNKKKMDKFITTYRPNFIFKQLDKMPKKLKDMEGMSLYVETAYSPVYTNHPLVTNPKFIRNEAGFRKYNISNKYKSQNDRNLHKTPNYHKQIQERNDLYSEYRNSLSPTASSYIPPIPLIPQRAMLHPPQNVPSPSPNTYKLNNLKHPHIQLPHHYSQTPTSLPGHQPVLLRNVHPNYHPYTPPQDVPHVYYSQPSRAYHLSKDPYQLNSYNPVPRSSFEIIPTHYGYSNPYQPTSHKPVYKKVKSYTANKSKKIPKYSITFSDDQKPSYPSYQSNVYSNISLSSKVGNKAFSDIRPISKPKYVRANHVYDVQTETTTISSKNYRLSDTSTKSPIIRDLTTSSPYEYRITTKQPALVQSSTSYPYSVSLEGVKHYKISKSKKVLGGQRSIPDVGPGSAVKEYPIHNGIPRTPFTCVGKVTGYYADLDAQCEVFHMCQFRGHKSSFLCPNGTLFNQRVLTCDHHRNVKCENSYKYYKVNRKVFKKKRMTNYDKDLKDFENTISNYDDINSENDIYGSLERPEDLKVKYSLLRKASYPTTQPSFSIETKRSTFSTSKSVKTKPSVATTTSNYEDGNNIDVNRIGVPVTTPNYEDRNNANVNRIGAPVPQHHSINVPNSSQETEPKPSSQIAQHTQAQYQPSSTEIMKLAPVIRSTQPHIINPVKVQPYVL